MSGWKGGGFFELSLIGKAGESLSVVFVGDVTRSIEVVDVDSRGYRGWKVGARNWEKIELLVLAHHFLDFVAKVKNVFVEAHVIWWEFEIFLAEQLGVVVQLQVYFFKLFDLLWFGVKEFILLIGEVLDVLQLFSKCLQLFSQCLYLLSRCL